MKERPILFGGGMIRAILAGVKTQTRRVLAVQPPRDDYQLFEIYSSTEKRTEGKLHWALLNEGGYGFDATDSRYFSCPYGKPGDMLWVREAWGVCPHCGTVNWKQEEASRRLCGCRECMGEIGRWRPSIHMFREYSRITLEIVHVRVERVQEITPDDIAAEGLPRLGYSSLDSWIELWDSINAQRGYGWDVNPWVWVVEFRRVNAATACRGGMDAEGGGE